jgi:hypothetical protein
VKKVKVYNPQMTPVVYGPSMVIGGLEWVEVDQKLVQAQIDSGRLIVKHRTVRSPIEVKTRRQPEEHAVVNGSDEDALVDFVQETKEDAGDTVKDGPSEGTSMADDAATIKKPRRRKPQPLPEKE